MRLLACGARVWGIVPPNTPDHERAGAGAAHRALRERERTYREIALLAPDELVHGAAPGGDTTSASCAMDWALHEGRPLVIMPFAANWRRGNGAGHARNAGMLRESRPDRGLAFGPLWHQKVTDQLLLIVSPAWSHTGTGNMVARMLSAGLPVRWIATYDAPTVDLVAMPRHP